jgi:uncharacterized protein YjbI with pentapeptide repeats
MIKGIITQQEFDTLLGEHQAWLAGTREVGQLVLDNVDLIGLQMRGALDKAILIDCDMTATVFNNCTVSGMELRGCTLNGAQLNAVTNLLGDGPRMTGCNFRDSTWSGVRLYDVDLSDIDMTGGEARNLIVQGGQVSNVKFGGRNLGGGKFQDLRLEACDFTDSDLGGRALIRCDFDDCALPGLVVTELGFLKENRFVACDLTGFKAPQHVFDADTGVTVKSFQNSTLTGSDFRAADLRQVVVQGCDFTGSELVAANFTGRYMFGCTMDGADARGAIFEFCRAYKVSFRDCPLDNAKFRLAHLSRAVFGGATLPRTDFQFADLTGASFEAAGVDASTVFIGAKLGGATWLDGRRCAAGSTSQCVFA